MRLRRWLGVVGLWPLLATAADYQPVIDEVSTELSRQMRGENIAGAAIALIDGQELVWTQGFGYADESERRLFDTHTPFPAGDFTKLATAIAILQLVEQGKLELDAGVDTVLDDLTIRSRFDQTAAPTIRQLLAHLGGLPNNIHAGSYQSSPPEKLTAPEEVYLAQRPGRIYAYSHLGYTLLGRVIERLSGQTYAEYIDKHVLAPLKMGHSGFRPRRAPALPHDRRARVQEPVYSRDQAALGLFTDIRDLSRLARFFLADDPGPVLNAASVARMRTAQNADNPLDLDNRSGLAWQLTNTGRHNVDQVLRLNTLSIQFRGVMLLAPAQGVGVMLIANASSAEQTVQDVARLALDAMLEARYQIPRPVDIRRLPERVDAPALAQDSPLHARYNTPLGEMRFTPNDGRHYMDFVGRAFTATKRDDGWYQIAYRLFGLVDLRFNIMAEILLRPAQLAGEQVLLAYFRGGTFLLGTTFAVTPDPVSRWVGRYHLSNPGILSERLELASIDLVVDEQGLYAKYELPVSLKLTPRVPLLPLGQGRYYIPGLGTNMGDEVQLREVDGQRRLEYSGWVFIAEP